MKKQNVIIILNKNEDKILMCKREKEPYKGLYNLVGGKLEKNENELAGAYRELAEETGITAEDTILYHMMDYKYYIEDITKPNALEVNKEFETLSVEDILDDIKRKEK